MPSPLCSRWHAQSGELVPRTVVAFMNVVRLLCRFQVRCTFSGRACKPTPLLSFIRPQRAATSCSHARSGNDVSAPSEQSADLDGDWLERSELILGASSLDALSRAHVIVVGLGGVGSWCSEFLVRSGVGRLTIYDGDQVASSNRNRQLPALKSTLGQSKARVMAQRLRDINPSVKLTVCEEFLEPDAAASLVDTDCSFIIDCIDSIAPKEELIAAALKAGKAIVSSMGAGGKLDPCRVQMADISQTYNDKMARLLRKGLRKRRGIQSGLPVVFSAEPMVCESMAVVDEIQRFKRSFYGTMSYMPALFGLHLAAYVICQLCNRTDMLHYPLLDAQRAKAARTKRTKLKASTKCNRLCLIEPPDKSLPATLHIAASVSHSQRAETSSAMSSKTCTHDKHHEHCFNDVTGAFQPELQDAEATQQVSPNFARKSDAFATYPWRDNDASRVKGIGYDGSDI